MADHMGEDNCWNQHVAVEIRDMNPDFRTGGSWKLGWRWGWGGGWRGAERPSKKEHAKNMGPSQGQKEMNSLWL